VEWSARPFRARAYEVLRRYFRRTEYIMLVLTGSANLVSNAGISGFWLELLRRLEGV
jgi:hypothetical protein